MKTLSTLIALLLLSSAHAENILQNGDFSEKDDGWQGDIRVKKEKGGNNRFALIELHKRNQVMIFNSTTVERSHSNYQLSLKYKTDEDYTGGGLEATVHLAVGLVDGKQAFKTKTFQLNQTDEWTTLDGNISFESDFRIYAGLMIFRIRILPGDGAIFLDDIQLTAVAPE